MKMLKTLLLVSCYAHAYAEQSIYEQPPKLSEEKLLFNFYSEEILSLNEQHLESVFYEALAWLDSLDSFEQIMNDLPQVQKKLQFILDRAEKESRLFAAAQLKSEQIAAILEASPKTPEEFSDIVEAYQERKLQQWARTPLAMGKELREQVFLNIQRDPNIAEAFYEYALLSEETPEVCLGYVESEVEVLGIIPDEEGGAALAYAISYTLEEGCSWVRITTHL